MNEPEDLRGRHFTWHDSGGVPPTVVIVEDPVEIGRLTRVPDLRPTYFAQFAGGRLRIEHSVGVLGPTFEVHDADSMSLVARSHYASDASLGALIGDRAYALRRSSATTAAWNDGVDDAVSLRADEGFVLMGADPFDAAPLLLLGIVMAIENTLFPASTAWGRNV